MKIFDKQPNTWQELEQKCAKILADIGFKTEVEKNIETVRGIVNIDVYAINDNYNPNETILVECKNWTNKVPKNVVHSFRSVVADFGANSGYIISKAGFQSGSFEAIKNTNISLMNFDEFQEYFKTRYLNYITTKLQKIGYPLRKYSDRYKGVWDKEVEKLPREKQILNYKLMEQYDSISMASLIFNYKNTMTGELEEDYVEHFVKMYSEKFPNEVTVNSYSDYFDFLIDYCQKGVNEFDQLFGKKLRK